MKAKAKEIHEALKSPEPIPDEKAREYITLLIESITKLVPPEPILPTGVYYAGNRTVH